jgi:hypothetical protein
MSPGNYYHFSKFNTVEEIEDFLKIQYSFVKIKTKFWETKGILFIYILPDKVHQFETISKLLELDLRLRIPANICIRIKRIYSLSDKISTLKELIR